MSARHSSRALVTALVLWLVTFFLARFALEMTTLAPAVRIGAALLPLPFFAAFLILFIRGVRSADELERRIQGEALAIAYPLALVLLMTLALMERAVGLKFHTWFYLPLFYFAGLAIARRRYL